MNLPGLGDRPIRIQAFGKTDTGRTRSENQDSFLIADLSRSAQEGGFRLEPDMGRDETRPGAFMLGEKGSLFLVADGMGGAAGGAVASKLASSYIYEALATQWIRDRNHSPQQFATRLVEAVQQANSSIHASSQRGTGLEGMGSTVTAVGALDGFLFLGQVGDSRAYLVRRGEIHQLTRDQSVVQQLVDAGELTEEEAEHSKRRNMILQALGTAPSVAVDLTYQEVKRGDTLVLCSDGLSGQVPSHEIGSLVSGNEDLIDACDALIALANERGGPDNITVVIARLDGEGLDEPAPEDPVGRSVYEWA